MILFKQLYDDYFIYEDNQNFICGGINKISNLSEVIISKMVHSSTTINDILNVAETLNKPFPFGHFPVFFPGHFPSSSS